MIENLRNQERLSAEAENRIEKRIRIVILAVMAAVLGIILWAAFQHKTFGTLYYATILVLLVGVWSVKYVAGAILKHSLAQRSDAQVSAYLKAAGMEFVAYAGLGWFLLAMTGNAIIGAAIYMFGVTGARRQKDIYEGYAENGEADRAAGAIAGGEAPSSGEGQSGAEDQAAASSTAGESQAGDADGQTGVSAASGAESARSADSIDTPMDAATVSLDHLPSAADRMQREEMETEDGSV